MSVATGRRETPSSGRRIPRSVHVLLAALTALISGLALSFAVPSTPAHAQVGSPTYSGDFPDPDVINVGGTYYAYSTQVYLTNIPTMHSTDLVHWSPLTDALPQLPTWATWGYTWAPSVSQTGPSAYVMYYTVRDTASNRQCISVATSTVPTGPFVDNSSGPLVCQLDHGGDIDPSPFVTTGGTRYLIWKSDDNAIGQVTHLWSQPLAADGLSLQGQPTMLLTSDAPWQAGIIEGPSMVLSGGTYYLLYGGNAYYQSSSAIGYGTCAGPLGPCQDVTVAGPWLGSTGSAVGPQGPAFFTTTSGQRYLAFDAWNGPAGYPNGGVRSLWLSPITMLGGQPVLVPYPPVPGLLGAEGTDHGLWTKTSDGAYVSLAGGLSGAPALAAVPRSTGSASALYVVTGSDHRLWARDDAHGYQLLTPDVTYCIDNPAAVVTGAAGNATLTVACQGGDHALYMIQGAIGAGSLPRLTGWRDLGGVLTAGPAVAPVGGTLTFLANGTGGRIWSRTTSTLFVQQPWLCLGHPALTTSGSTTTFACDGTDGALWYATNAGGGWSPASSAGGTLVDGPGVAATSAGTTFFGEGSDAGVWLNFLPAGGGPDGWIGYGGTVSQGVGAVGLG